MNRVLIALDYEPSAEVIARTGHELARSMNAQTILLHVISDNNYYISANYSPIMGYNSLTNADVIENDAESESKRLAWNYLEHSKKYLGDPDIEVLVGSGSFAQTILDTAESVKADLIVMGTHHQKGLKKLITGSVAESVLHHTQIPVLIIPTRPLEERA